jgi:nicotinamidase-related amidase
MKTALILIDIQNDYFPGGKMELVGAEEAGQRAAEVLEHFRAEGLPVIHIRHISTHPGSTFLLPDTEGAQIHASVAPLPGETVFEKHFPNSFRETPLLEHLRKSGIERLVIAGMMTSMCVDATARAAFDYGFHNVLLHEAMATRNLAFYGETIPAAMVHGAFLAALGSVYGTVTGMAEFLRKEQRQVL